MDLLKTVLVLSTGAVAFYFARISDNPKVLEACAYRLAVLSALCSFVVAALTGLGGWVVVFRLYYVSAKSVEAGPGNVFEAQCKRLKRIRNGAFLILPVAFALGVVCSSIAIWTRLP